MRPSRHRPYYASLDRGYRAAVRATVERQRRTIRTLEAENRALRGWTPVSERALFQIRLHWMRAWRRWGI
jgi:hypothetical protein